MRLTEQYHENELNRIIYTLFCDIWKILNESKIWEIWLRKNDFFFQHNRKL